MKIIFLAPYPPDRVASQRFRFEQYFKFMEEKEIKFEFHCFYPSWAFEILYQKKNPIKKIFGILTGYFRRFFHLFSCFRADYVMIHRELAPLGPPIFEWFLIFVFRKKVIFDFDDALWISDDSARNKWWRVLRWNQKFEFICKNSNRVSAGNPYLAEYASRYNSRVTVNPTTLDTSLTHPLNVHHEGHPVTIGWTGSHSTLKYLYPLLDTLQQVLMHYQESRLLIICDHKPDWKLEGMEFIYWDKSREWEDLSRMHIGIMPLPDNSWTRGKGGFKIMEYFALGIPSLASPVGINTSLIEHGKNGFLCAREKDWILYLDKLIPDASLREKLGQAGKKMVEERFSVQSNLSNFLGLFA